MSKLEDVQSQKSFQYLQEVEELAQNILTAKEEKIQFANTQNKLREALRALQDVEERRTWFKIGCVYIERPTEECQIILKNSKNEQFHQPQTYFCNFRTFRSRL